MRSIFFDVFRKAADARDKQARNLKTPPVWAKDDTRAGGYGKLDQIVDAPTGYQKLDDLLSGMPDGTYQAYFRGWRHWVQYCTLRCLEPWVTVGWPGWGEAILDFIMFEHAVLGLKPSTTTGQICAIRYFHVIRGRADFSAPGVRYKPPRKSLTKRLPISQKLPYNVDLMTWEHGNFFLKGRNPRKIKEIWAGFDLGVFYLLRASEITQMRQKEVEIGVEKRKKKSGIPIYRSQTDPGRLGRFRTLVKTGPSICPVRSVILYLISFDWGCESDAKLPPST